MRTSPRPFQRLPFADLPATPRKPHPYFQTDARDVRTRSEGLGEVRIHYRVTGAGAPLLLIHGLMTTSYSWRYVLEPLGKKYRVFAPDLPGCGRSEGPPGGAYGASSIAAWIADFQRAVGIEGCAAIGNSLGGYLCMRLALARPEALSRLVNIHSPAFPDFKVGLLGALLRVPGMKRLAAWLARRDPPRWAHRNVHYYDETLKSIEEAREYGDPLSSEAGSRAFASYLAETLAPKEMRAFVRELEARGRRGERFPIPLMLLYSRTDALVSPINGERLHAIIPGSELAWIEQSSHFAHVDTPEQVVRLVEPFLERLSSTG